MSGAEIRGACPTLAAPMATGDGLLARLHPSVDGLTPTALAGLAEAANIYGNGIVEVTARGSLQIRGLSEDSASLLARAVDALNIAIRSGVPIDTPPLAGLDHCEIADPRPLAQRLRRAIGDGGLNERLAPKVSVVVDGGGALHLSEIIADVRLTAEHREDRIVWNLALGGRAAQAAGVAALAEDDAFGAVVYLLEAIATKGMRARARDLDDTEIASALQGLSGLPYRRPRSAHPPQPVGQHPLKQGGHALGVGFAYSQVQAETLAELAHRAATLGIEAVRCAPGRAILFLCPTIDVMQNLRQLAQRYGFIVDSCDKRLSITACAGAPACCSAHLATKTLAARLLAEAPELFGGGLRLHLSGCDKRCAQPRHSDAAIIGGEDGTLLQLSDGTTWSLPKRPAEPPVRALFRRAAEVRQKRTFQEQSAVACLREAVEGENRRGSHESGRPMNAQDYIKDGTAIYERSFAIIRAEADLSRFTPAEADIAVRMIHACGQVEAAAHFVFSDGFVNAARAALNAGAPILCDAEMVAHGVTRARLPADNEVICTLRDPRTPELAARIGNTRSAAALELWRERLEGALVAIGNAPTALFHLLDMLEAGAPRPAAIIGMPVGFVGAAESKDALFSGPHGIPFAIVRGRMGGSAMTAAAVNAIARAGL